MDKRMSSAFHPQTDGQTERTNRTLEEMLRAYISLEHDDWDAKLACAEFAINNSWQETVKNTPFFLNYGQHPLTPATKQLSSTVPKAADFAEGIVKSVKEARKCMEAKQQKMKARADKHTTHGNLSGTCLVVTIWSRSIKLRETFLKNHDLSLCKSKALWGPIQEVC